MPGLPSPEELAATFAAALRRRASVSARDTDAFRAVHGHADGVPDVTVDSYGGECCVVSTYAQFGPGEERALAQACVSALGARAVYVKRRPKEARHVANVAAGDVAPKDPVLGAKWEAGVAKENGLRYRIRPHVGLSVGLFLDMRDPRGWLRAHVNGKTVLNCFAYTCAFSVVARAGGAARAVNIDVSRRVLDWGVENHEENGFAVEQRDFIAGDVFDWLARFGKKGEMFDVVVLDPPSFANTAKSRFSAAKDYPKLVQSALGVVADGGLLMSCCNLAQLDDAGFAGLVEKGFALAGRRPGKQTRLGASAVDFPPHPQTPHGLHVLAVQT